MHLILDAWWKLFDQSPKWHQIVLQTWIYGFFCYVHDCQDAKTWVPIPFHEFYDYANEFREIPEDLVTETLAPLVRVLQKTHLIDALEFQILYKKFLDTADEKLPDEINILEDLFTGEDLSEEVREKIWNELALRLPESIKQNKHSKHPHTRRIHGRRAITPIRRRHGRKALTAKILHK